MYKRPLFEKANLIGIHVQEWLRKNNSEQAKPREVMQYLIEKGIFTHDHREGGPLRDVLRKLDEKGRLDLVRGLCVERKAKNRYWYFKRVTFEDGC